ncbi:hypothetical protein L596_015546 [Steinernema carpocapsae]|uniref:Uncharacterized protein n=1 Tax=Steinernema carpocapsae TaxID=34508 RepID=A0A4U5NFA4_STECR|nr:hypothetical protein L596_015546 [Steinernema carpocapsae]
MTQQPPQEGPRVSMTVLLFICKDAHRMPHTDHLVARARLNLDHPKKILIQQVEIAQAFDETRSSVSNVPKGNILKSLFKTSLQKRRVNHAFTSRRGALMYMNVMRDREAKRAGHSKAAACKFCKVALLGLPPR